MVITIENKNDGKRMYISIADIQREYLPVSKKKIRALVKTYLSTKYIGGRMYVERAQLEQMLQDPDRHFFPLD